MIKKTIIKNFKSIKDSDEILFSDKLFVLAGQNESGKSSILEALKAFEDEKFERDSLNFEEERSDNLTQVISCFYTVEEDGFFDDLITKIQQEFSIGEGVDFIDKDKVKKIKEYVITKSFNHGDKRLSVHLNKPVIDILKGAIKNTEKIEVDERGVETKTKIPFIDVFSNATDIANVFFSASPMIVLFNTFSDLLPDKILIADLANKNVNAEGYNAVKNLEKLLDKDFVSISKLSRTHKDSTTSIEVGHLSTKFQKAWKQRIYDDGDLKIRFDISNEDISGQAVPTVFFSIETKDNVFLEPRKRSKGMIWFLSAWLDLKAREDGFNLAILYDEPGLYLHVKAHSDILGLFKELVCKGHQVIYSTHSPSLIDTSSLHNIGLVLNTKDEGTVVEGLTTSKINTDYKQDALQPVAEAMGLEPLKNFTVLTKKNVLLEGLSDFWYFQSMTKVLNVDIDYKFVPGIGIKFDKINSLISFCLGYGLEWLLIMDKGNNPQTTYDNLKETIFNGDDVETDKQIKILGFDEIENMFTASDLKLVDAQIRVGDSRKPIAIIGKNRKIIFAREFARRVEDNKITKDNLSEKTLKNFKEVFEWINKQFNG
ncbi:MAG: AAA family ATPase [bacterium]